MDVIRAANGPMSFFKRRLSQARREFNLRQRTYIVPTIFGLIFGVLCVILLLMALSYANNLLYMIVFFLISVALSSMVQTNKNIDSLYIRGVDASGCYANIEGGVQIFVENKEFYPCCNVEIYVKGHKKEILHFLPTEKKYFSLSWIPNQRGFIQAPIIYLASTYPFGLLRSWKKIQWPDQVLVYPERRGKSETPSHLLPFDDQLDQMGIFRDLREYQKGDNPRQIHWLSSVRHQKMLIKNFDQEVNEPEISFDWEDTRELNHLEDRLSQLCLWLYEAETLGVQFRLILPQFDSGFGKGQGHLCHCLDVLAQFEDSAV